MIRRHLRFFLTLLVLFALAAGMGDRYSAQMPWVKRNPLVGRALSANLTGLLPSEEQEVSFELFWKIWELAEERHIDGPVDSKPLVYGAINGLFKFGYKDGYSFFLPPQMSRFLGDQQSQRIGSTGITFDIVGTQVVVADVLLGSGAETAGVLPGDILVKIKENPVRSMSLFELEQALSGEAGTVVPLELSRKTAEGSEERLSKSIRLLPEPETTLEWSALGEDIFYLRLLRFTKQTETQWANAAALITEQHPAGLVLDLRSNTGGYTEGVAAVVDDFLEKGILYRVETNTGEIEKIQATPAATFPDIPVVVLTNRGTASSAEIVAASLKDNERATLMGTPTFGKAAIISIETIDVPGEILPAVLGLVKAYWLPPRSDSVREVGVVPTIEVEVTTDSYSTEKDTLLDKALSELQRLEGLQSGSGGQP